MTAPLTLLMNVVKLHCVKLARIISCKLFYNGGAMRSVLLADTIKLHETIRKTDV